MPSIRISPSRSLAFRVLREVDRGGFASDLLHERAGKLDPRDAALATELTLGSLRRRPQLDHLIRRFSGRDPAQLEPPALLALRLGIYQLRYLDRIPAHAAVGESVELTRRNGAPRAAGLVNAVLRKVNRDPVSWPDRAVELCMPAWLLDKWDRDHGPHAANRIAAACLEPPETYLRVPPGREPEAAALGAQPSEVPGCWLLPFGEPGPFRVQDIGSQCVVPMLGLEAGHRFLDLCAGAGGKTAQALETAVWAVACDSGFERLSHAPGHRVLLDGVRPLPFSARFERILVDAPCSGTGTLRRNPEIRWRIQREDLPDHQRRQAALLRNALERLAPGGRLVYATCSLEPEENECVVEEIRAERPDVDLIEKMRRIPGRDSGDGFYAAVLRSQ